jgi:DNA-directed RNA polymerase specialized sigma24 family protein
MAALSHPSPEFFTAWLFGTRRGPCVEWPERAEPIARVGSIPGSQRIQGAELRTMERVEPEPRLSQMTTHWTAVIEAHSGTAGQVNPAVSRLMCRYAGAVHRYFLKAVKNPDDAEELDQEFAVRFLRGDFRRSSRDRGRFRDYVKRAVQNMISDHFRRKNSSKARNSLMSEPPVADPALSRFEGEFIASWRNDLLDRAWNALAALEQTSGQPYHTVLRFRVDNPDIPSDEAADRLSRIVGRLLSAGAVRQAVMRSRRKFVDFLIAEVLESMDHPSQDELEEELGDLKLLEYCRPFLKRRASE